MSWQYQRHVDFTGGENRNRNITANPNQLLLARNVVLRPDGALETRKGKTLVTDTLYPGIQNILKFQRDNGIESLAVQCSDKLVILSYDGTSAPVLKTILDIELINKCSMLFWKNKLFFGNTFSCVYYMALDTQLGPPAYNNDPGDLIYNLLGNFLLSADGSNLSVTPMTQPKYVNNLGIFISIDLGDIYSLATFSLTIVNFTTGANHRYSSQSITGFFYVDNVLYSTGQDLISEGGTFYTRKWDNLDTTPTYTVVSSTLYTGLEYTFPSDIISLERYESEIDAFRIRINNGQYKATIDSSLVWTVEEDDPAGIILPIDAALPISPEIKSDIMCVYSGRLWLVDGAINKNKLICSDLEDPLTYDPLNAIEVRSGDGDEITALHAMPDYLVICKRHSTWILYGNDYRDWQLTRSPIGFAGAVNPFSITGDASQYFFIGHDNIYRGTAQGIQQISMTHQPIIASMTESDRQLAFVVGLPFDKSRIVVSLGTVGVLNVEAVLNGITSWDSLSATCGCGNNLKDDDGYLLTGDATGHLNKYDGTTDNGTAIVTTIIPAYVDGGTMRKKVWRRVIPSFMANGGGTASLTVIGDVDYSATTNSGEITSLIGLPGYASASTVTATDYANVETPVEFHALRGVTFTPVLQSSERIVFNGYTVAFREAGPLL